MNSTKSTFFDFRGRTKRAFILLLCCVVMATTQLTLATPSNNPYEPVMIHTVMGTDKFYTKKSQNEFKFTLSPYYLHTATAKNGSRKKVPAGERLGPWNMFGVFYGIDKFEPTALTPKPVTAIYDKIKLTGASALSANFVNSADTTNKIVYPDPDSSIFKITDSGVKLGSFLAVPVAYEKFGLRSQMSLDLGFGCGLVAKGGIADCRATPKFTFDEPFYTEAAKTGDPKIANDNILSPAARETVATALSIDLNEYRKTDLEDLHVQAYWDIPFDLKDKEGDVAVTMVPHLAVGAWIPVAKAVDVDKIFASPLGNDGFWSMTADGALTFDFAQSIQMSLGGGVVVSETKTVSQRMPNDSHQSGLYPWKTQVSKQPGTTWYMNASFKSDDFTGGLSFYFDYIFTQHLKDSLSILDSNTDRKTEFNKALDKAVQESAWRSQQWQAGLSCKVTDRLAFGFAVQSHITGVRVYRPTTVLGSMTFTF